MNVANSFLCDGTEYSDQTDDAEYSAELTSIGHLQHKLQMISVKLFEKDIELKKQQMQAIAKEDFLKVKI